MELGRSVLKRSNVNALTKAIHPRHGLVWSDGKAIFLGSIDISNDAVQNSSASRLGEFDNVESVCWSCDINEETCFMSVVHHNNVTVWKVSGFTPKLSFKQVRKINVKPILQGVLWNPKCDVLCLFSRNQVSFYFNHISKKGSYAFPPLVSGKITCGCWSNDGNKLLVCVGSSLLIYTWPDIENSLSDFMPSAWTLPKSDGNVTAIVPINHIKYICCVDLPLERLCQNQDVYLMPELPSSQTRSDSISRKYDVIESGKSTSIKQQLLNLPANPEAIINDSSQLIYFQINDDDRSSVRLNTVSLHGLVSPDLLTYQSNGCVIVGSNSLPNLQVFTVSDSNLIKTGEINLEKSERPKGIHHVSDNLCKSLNGVLILVGRSEKKDDVFPSATAECNYELVVRVYPVKPDASLQHSQSHSEIIPTKPKSTLTVKTKSISESALPKVHVTNTSNNEKPIKIQLIQTNSNPPTSQNLVSNLDGTKTSSVALETETTDFKESVPKFKHNNFNLIHDVNKASKTEKKRNVDENRGANTNKFNLVDSQKQNNVENGVKIAETDGSDTSNISDSSRIVVNQEDALSDPGLASISLSTCSDENYEILESLVENQKDQIEELQKKVQCLSQLVDESSVINLTKYQTPEKPDFVKISCLYENGNSVTRKFLLDNGRLQLDSIKRAFKLNYVGILIDDEPMILGANIDGYIPLKFTPGSTLQVIGENQISL